MKRQARCFLFYDTVDHKWRLRTRDSRFYVGEIPFKVVINYEVPETPFAILEAKLTNLEPKVLDGIIEALENAQRIDEETTE